MHPEVSKEEFLEAFRDGVTEAIYGMTESGNGFNGPIIREPFLKAVSDGVTQAFSGMDNDEALEAIRDGVCAAFPELKAEELKNIYFDAVKQANQG